MKYQSIYNRNLMKIILKSNPLWISICMIFNKQNHSDWYYIKMIILMLLLMYPSVELLGVTSSNSSWSHCVRFLIWKGMKQFPHPQDRLREKSTLYLQFLLINRLGEVKFKKTTQKRLGLVLVNQPRKTHVA